MTTVRLLLTTVIVLAAIHLSEETNLPTPISINGDSDLWQVPISMRCYSSTGSCSRFMNFPYISVGSDTLTVQHATLSLRTVPPNNNWRMTVSLVCSLVGQHSSVVLCSSVNSNTPKCRISIPIIKRCPFPNPIWSLELIADEGVATETELQVDGTVWACKDTKCTNSGSYESWKKPVMYVGIVLGSLLLVIAISRRVWLNASTGGGVAPKTDRVQSRASLTMMLTSWRASFRNTFSGTWKTTRSSVTSNTIPDERSSIVRSPISKHQAITSVM